ncbi:porin family protein [Salinimicrobium sp. GXAS 041]|uniref:porin family protein n=1 Tax=Salinimicrobium sp. GXAS 041 TaxID=3400806 RepID=UPI003C767B79
MRKHLLLGFLSILTFGSVKAQEINFGVKGGLNISNLHSSNTPVDEITESRTGFHAGAFGELRFSNLFALQVEALYSQQGATTTIAYIPIDPPGELGYFKQSYTKQQNQDLEAKGRYDYLNLPVLAKFYVYKGLNVYGGPQLSVLLSAKDEYESVENDVKDQLDPFDFGLNGGVGYQFEMGLFFSASYYWGINNISHIDYSNVLGYDINIHQGAFQFSTGYRF